MAWKLGPSVSLIPEGSDSPSASGTTPACAGSCRRTRSAPLHKICLRAFCARASGAVFAPAGRSPRRSGPSRPSGRCRLRRPRPLRLEVPPLCACRCTLCGLSVNPASLIVRRTQRQAARGPVFARWATPRRARRNVGSNYVRPATGQRRLTACVMRSFGRRLPHTLPFPAHPRVRLRLKKGGSRTRHIF